MKAYYSVLGVSVLMLFAILGGIGYMLFGVLDNTKVDYCVKGDYFTMHVLSRNNTFKRYSVQIIKPTKSIRHGDIVFVNGTAIDKMKKVKCE